MTTPLMLFENVPLVSTEKLGSFTEAKLIGHHYGDLSRSRVRCIKVDPVVYLVGAHPWQIITACWVGKKKTDGWEPLVQVDTDGITRQYVKLTAPPADDDPIVEVAGKGKVSPISGKLLENPDEIIEDIARLGGRELNFPLFREACNRRGLRIAGSVYEARTMRDYINEIIESVGAKWLGTTALFWPDTLGYAKPVDFPDEVSHELSVEDVAGVMGVYYGWNQSEERNGAYIELKAIGCQYDNKGVHYSRWLRLARDAEALARRLLSKRAGTYCKTRATVPGIARAGDTLAIASDTFPGSTLILSSTPNEVSSDVAGETIIDLHNIMEVSQFSNENNTLRSESIDVLFDQRKMEVRITVSDSQQRPMVGIFVTYDGVITQKTDKLGSVTLSVSSGNHTLVLNGGDIDNNDPYPLYIP